MRARHGWVAWAAAGLLALPVAVSLVTAPRADAFVYWPEYGGGDGAGSIGRANLDGTGVDHSFITGTDGPCGIAVDADHIYWANLHSGTIGRANLDGSHPDQSLITGADEPCGVAVDAAHVYWADVGGGSIGRANLDGTDVDHSFITGIGPFGIAVDAAYVYWVADSLGTASIGRANLDGTGVEKQFIPLPLPLPTLLCGPAVDASHIYWSNTLDDWIGRASVDGTDVTHALIRLPVLSFPCGVGVDGANIYWSNEFAKSIGRSNLDGTGVDPYFICEVNYPLGSPAADAGSAPPPPSPSNDLSLCEVTKNKKKGTAGLIMKTPGPGEVELAKSEHVRGAELRVDVAETVRIPVRPRGKTKKDLKKHGKTKVTAAITFRPEGGGRKTESIRLGLKRK